MGRFFLNLIATAMLVQLAPTLYAQAPTDSSSKTAKIGVITVTGARKIPAEQIVAASGFKPGDVVSAQQIQEAADRLAALGLFSRVNYRFTPKGDAISLEFQVQEAPTVPLLFDNFPWFTDDELAAAIRQKLGLFSGEAPESGAMIDEITGILDNLLAPRKIAGAITHQLVAQPVGDGMIMQFRVDDSRLLLHSVKFGDPLATDSERLKDRVPDIQGQPYSRFAIEIFENEQVRPLYAAKGFLRAQIGPPQSQLAGEAAPAGQSGVDVLIPITPGAVYSWKGAFWQGNSLLLSSTLDSMILLKPGEVADGMKTEDSWRDIEATYEKSGYLDVKLDAQPQFDDTAHQISYRVTISEGPQYRMGDMIITGLSVDGEKALRHAWQIAPGQVFDNAYFEKFLKSLVKPSPEIFGEMPIHYSECGHWLRPNADRHTVDVLLDFK